MKNTKLHDEFIENTITLYSSWRSSNFLINGTIPMAIEESSVAAASKSANYWSTRGGFKATVINTEKIGQVHFLYVMFQNWSCFVQNSKVFSDTESINMQKEVVEFWTLFK
jgi:hydroxymethylglutaryl-CoA reductase